MASSPLFNGISSVVKACRGNVGGIKYDTNHPLTMVMKGCTIPQRSSCAIVDVERNAEQGRDFRDISISIYSKSETPCPERILMLVNIAFLEMN